MKKREQKKIEKKFKAAKKLEQIDLIKKHEKPFEKNSSINTNN